MRWVASFLLVLHLFVCSALQPVGLEWILAAVWAESGKSQSDKVTATTDFIEVSLPGLPEDAYPMRLVRIPAGTFQMGSSRDERGGWSWEDPVHTVTITHDFYLGETEVTQGQWQAIMNYNPADDYDPAHDYGIGPDYPVYYVSWNDIMHPNGFLDRLDSQTDFTGFRLPTEAEWEYAGRAGTTTRFYFGDSLSCTDDCQDCTAGMLPGNRSDFMWYCYNTPWLTGSHPVGGRLPNPFGLYDMHGNVAEWCQDWYQNDFYSQPGTQVNPLCDNSSSNTRVTRGGYWLNFASFCRSASRASMNPSSRSSSAGFRVVLNVESSSVDRWKFFE